MAIGKFTASDTTEFHIAYNPSDKNEICTRDTIKDNYIGVQVSQTPLSCQITP